MRPAKKLEERPPQDEGEVRRLIEVVLLVHSHESFIMVKASQSEPIDKKVKILEILLGICVRSLRFALCPLALCSLGLTAVWRRAPWRRQEISGDDDRPNQPKSRP